MSMYAQFETDPDLEKNGVWIDYGDFRVLLGRAGGANKKYLKYAEEKSKPFRRAIAAGVMPEKRSKELLFDIYAKTIIMAWEVSVGTDDETGDTIWKSGIHMPNGDIGEASYDNFMMTFRKLPDVFFDLQKMAEQLSMFRKEELEEEAKNSLES